MINFIEEKNELIELNKIDPNISFISSHLKFIKIILHIN